MFEREKSNLSQKNKEQIKGALSYEQDKERMYKRSNKIAWSIAICSFALLPITVGLGGYFGSQIIEKISEPKLLSLDKSTGIMDYVTVVNKDTITELDGRENLDKFFVNNYIQLRESYTSQTIQKTYNLTQLFSSEDVADDFRKEYDKKDSLDQVLKTGTAKVTVISITLENIGNENLATARVKVDYNDTQKTYSKNFVIRLAYEYKPNVGLDLSERMENPVGFFVTSYQKVQESL
ncbi:TPA: virB8 family protein [Haemophilus influenzae]|jgi:type IV secretion system protein VirB8